MCLVHTCRENTYWTSDSFSSVYVFLFSLPADTDGKKVHLTMSTHEANGEKKSELSPPPLEFARFIEVEQIDDGLNSQQRDGEQRERTETFRNLTAAVAPVQGINRVFGGYVSAQAAYAAFKTVPEGFLIHVGFMFIPLPSSLSSPFREKEMTLLGRIITQEKLNEQNISGSYVLQGHTDVPFIYTVRHIRDGKNYAVRAVDARQGGRICFTCLCSFKRAEKYAPFSHQPIPLQETYKSLLAGKKPQDHLPSPGVDVDWFIEQVKEGYVEEGEFPGVFAKKVDMQDFNQRDEVKREPDRYRQLLLYSLRSPPDGSGGDKRYSNQDLQVLKQREDAGEFDNLYACAHLYACDKNSLFVAARALDHQKPMAIASLSMTVIFHRRNSPLRMVDWDAAFSRKDQQEGPLPMKWYIQENWTPGSGDNRVGFESRIFAPDGTLLATVLQDGQLRLADPDSKL